MIGLYQLVFLLFAVCVVGVLLGFKFAIHIHNPVLYILFWAMYIITGLSLISLLANLYFYDSLRYKTGTKGQVGERGEDGIQGETGVCESNCRDDMLYLELMTYSEEVVNKLENSDGKPIQISNKYWKDRISMIAKSVDVSNLINIKGRDHVIDYLKNIFKIWLDLLYKEGGRTYFETIGAENEFEWRKFNPWNEIKQYDVYYWGMRSDMRIKQISKCRPKLVRDKTPRLKVITTDDYNQIWHQKHNIGRSDSNRTLWRPKVLHQNGEKMHPIGDVLLERHEFYRTQYGNHTRGHMSFDGTYETGPPDKTVLVSGSATKPATGAYDLGSSYYRWCKDWLCRISGYRIGKRRKSHVNFWRLTCPNGFKALGDVAMPHGPGGPKPDYNNYRCISEDCLEPINKGANRIFTPEGSRQGWKSFGDEKEHNNVFHITERGKNDDVPFYKIKEDCLTVDEVPAETDPVYNNGVYPPPEKKDRKYSVMNYMGLPTHAILVNVGNPKVFIKIELSPNNKFNVYYIRYHSNNTTSGKSNVITLEAIAPNNLKWRSIIKDYNKSSLRWIVNMDDEKSGQMTILSDDHNQYLRYVNNSDIKLVQHNRMDNFGYWKIHT